MISVLLAAAMALQPGPDFNHETTSKPYKVVEKDELDPNDMVLKKVTTKRWIRTRTYFQAMGDKKVSDTRSRPERPAKGFVIYPRLLKGPPKGENNKRLDELNAFLNDAKELDAAGPLALKGVMEGKKKAQERLRAVKGQSIDPNMGVKPGGWTTRTYGGVRYRIITLVEVMEEVSDWHGTTTDVVKAAMLNLGEALLPKENPILNETFTPDDKGSEIVNKTGGVVLSDSNAAAINLGYIPLPRLQANYSFNTEFKPFNAKDYFSYTIRDMDPNRLVDIWSQTGWSPADGENILRGLAGQGSDMNSLTIPGDAGFEPPDCGSELVMPGGTTWIPDRSGYQAMMSYQPLRLNLSFSASVDGSAFAIQGRTHCLTIDAKPPEPGVRYYPFMPADDRLLGLAENVAKSPIRGPWHQAQTWIFTNKATIDEIGERLVGGVSEGQYVNGLFNVAEIGGFTPQDLMNKDLLQAEFLDAAGASNAAFDWLSTELLASAPADAVRWLKGSDELKRLASSPQDDFEKGQPARALRAFLLSDDEAARMAALEWIHETGYSHPDLEDALKLSKLGAGEGASLAAQALARLK